MTTKQLENILIKVLNSQIIKKNYPMIDKIVVKDVDFIRAMGGNFIVELEAHTDYNDWLSIRQELISKIEELLDTMEIGNGHNQIYLYRI